METIEFAQSVTLKNILLATDFSEHSAKTVVYAEALASKFGSKIYLVHVIPPQGRMPIPIEPWPLELDRPRLNEQQEMKAFLAEHAHLKVPHESLVKQGLIWETLSELIHRNQIDLMVLGTHGRGGLSKVMLGSVAEQIFRLAGCPVLIVGPAVPPDQTARREFRRILFATDFGPASLHALPYAIAFASDREARLMLLHVVAPVPTFDVGPYWYAGTNITDVVSQQREARANTIEKLKRLIPREAHLGSEPEFQVDFDYVPDSILKIAGDAEADLIVMGVNQSAWARVSAHLPWATAHEVLRRAKCPVLTVRS